MDNNENLGQQQQTPQQPANNMYQQQYQQFNQQNNFNMLEIISIICSGVGFLIVLLGTILTCTCSAKNVIEDGFNVSPIFILTIFGIIVSVAGVVLAIVAIKKTDEVIKADKIAKLAIAVGATAVLFGILPLVTICGYNCSLENAFEDSFSNAFGSLFN